MNRTQKSALLNLSAFLLPFINFGVFLMAGLVYSVAILVQYGWGVKNE